MAFRKEIHSETTIEASADEVWAVLSDFGSYGEWNPGMESVQGEGHRRHAADDQVRA